MPELNIDDQLAICKRATPGPAMWFTGCSWRRFGQVNAHGGNIMEPTNDLRDNHPDMIVKQWDMEYIEAAYNNYPEALRRLKRLREIIPEVMDEVIPETLPELYAELRELLGLEEGGE